MNRIGDYLNLHATALSVRAKRNNVLASNIANAATPNFKALKFGVAAFAMFDASTLLRFARTERAVACRFR